MNNVLSRRDLLLAGVAAAISAAGATGFPTALYAQADITVDQFVALSEKLTEQTGLDPGIAKTILGGFLATGNGPALADLVAGKDDATVANAIVAAWYSGVYNIANGQQAVATYDQALLWNALSYTKPQGSCGGATGYWSDPPEA